MTLAIDFSLDRLDVSLRGNSFNWTWGHRAYENNWAGWQQLKADLLHELARADASSFTVVGESTGPYWFHAFFHFKHDDQLRPFSPELALLNPAHVKGYRKALAQQDKSDPDDARLIDQYYHTVGIKHPFRFYDRYLPLRTLTRAYLRITHSLASEKAYLLSLLYLWASEYQRKEARPFSDLFGAGVFDYGR